jgi:DNA polymerase III delta prime subunit
MGRLQSIQKALQEINESVFQELCDHFLAFKNTNYTTIIRTGSAQGKQTTVKGTPDSLLMLPSGKYILVECSTNKTKGVKKLKEDIEKCIDSQKTGVPIDSIAEIIICINFNLTAKQIESLKEVIKDSYIQLSIHTLDSLAIEINFQHRDLAHEYLGLPLDTGQVVSMQTFLNEYDRAAHNIATPLTNTFFHREQELTNLQICLKTSDFVILTGAPGVGKTKLAIEGIRQYLSENPQFQCYCISYKNFELLGDLYQYLAPDNDYILFVDDANRIDAFSQITGFYKSSRKGKLKIVITVRDYALMEVERLCTGFLPAKIDLGKFDDEQLKEIIKGEPFAILNSDYLEPIIRIADGNPRLAIMAATLSKKEQSLLALKDVSDLFDQYFSTFVKDTDEFGQKVNLSVLGIISFFYTMPYKDRKTVQPILEKFGITYVDFVQAIDSLDRLELVEIQYEHVKIAEQNLATYFFYRAFIKEELLSFDVLLAHYFHSNQRRFRECVISALNTFDDDLILNKIRPQLTAYLDSVNSDHQRAMEFLDVFWYFLQNETLAYFYHLTENTALPTDAEYIFEKQEKKQDFNHQKDMVVEIISEFLRTGHQIAHAFQLGMEYVRKNPKTAYEFISALEATMSFSQADVRNGFFRPKSVIEQLLVGFYKRDILYEKVSFQLFKLWLKFQYRHTRGGRNHTIVMFHYNVSLIEPIKFFRETIWKLLDKNFLLYPNEIFNVLKEYGKISPDVVIEVMEFDMPFVLGIIDSHFDAKQFEQCLYVNDQLRWFKRKGLQSPDFARLLQRFRNTDYEIFLKVDWDRLRDKEMFEFDNYEKYEVVKEREIRNAFHFTSAKDALDFYGSFSKIRSLSKNPWSYNNTLDIVIEENFTKNPDIGLQLLKVVITEGNKIGYTPRKPFIFALKSLEFSEKIHALILANNFERKTTWYFAYYELLDQQLIKAEHGQQILELVASLGVDFHLHLDNLKKYLIIAPSLFLDILNMVTEKNELGIAKIYLWMDFFDESFDEVKENLSAVKKAYLQQIAIQDSHFDHELKGLKNILSADPSFILDYIKRQVRGRHSNDHRQLGFVWNLPDICQYMTGVFDDYIANSHYIFGNSFLNTFFNRIEEESVAIADKFLFDYMHANATDRKKVEAIIDIGLQSRTEIFEQLLLNYVEINQDPESFGRIFWLGHGGIMSGDINWGDKEAAGWRNIMAILDKSTVGFRLLPIKKYVSDMIEWGIKRGDEERRDRFLERD